MLIAAILLIVLFFDTLAAIYITTLILEIVEFFLSLLISFLLTLNLDKRTMVDVAGVYFFGSIGLVALFLAAGYVIAPVMFIGIAIAVFGFLSSLARLLSF